MEMYLKKAVGKEENGKFSEKHKRFLEGPCNGRGNRKQEELRKNAEISFEEIINTSGKENKK